MDNLLWLRLEGSQKKTARAGQKPGEGTRGSRQAIAGDIKG